MKKKIEYLEQQVKHLSFLNKLSKSLGSTLDPQEIIDIVASELSSIVQYDIFSLLFFSMACDSSQPPSKEEDMILKVKADFDIKGKSLDTFKYAMLKKFHETNGEDISVDSPFGIDGGSNQQKGKSNIRMLSNISWVKTYINIPLCGPNERKVGIINLASFDEQNLSEHTLEVLFDAANRASLALKNAVEYKKVSQLATLDGLTNVYNRMAFDGILQNEYSRAIRYNKPISLLMIDVDNLKVINDTNGHQAGDAVLRDISQVMLSSIRKTDMIARYGGDEFAIILPDTNIKKTDQLTKRIHDNIRKKCLPLNGNIQPSVSIGIANLATHTIFDCKELIKIADSALYDAKKHRRRISVR